jgi:hypothetical protein
MNPLSIVSGGLISPRGLVSQLQTIVGTLPLPPDLAQSILVKALELPLPSTVTKTNGIFQSDIILRTAIIAAIADVRANPWLLDYIFASLPKDNLTFRAYGEQEIQRAKDWFLNTDIPIFNVPHMDAGNKLPVITIAQMESSEINPTLGDVHYDPNEDADRGWPVLFGPFTPKSYTASTGVVTVDPVTAANFIFLEGQVLVDKAGKAYPIVTTDIPASNKDSDFSFAIAVGTVADFSAATVRAPRPAWNAALGSLEFKETYQVGCHVQGEQVHLTYLHSVLIFCLLRYKAALMDARGFERTTLSSSDFAINPAFDKENIFSRFVTITGYVRHSWPGTIDEKIATIQPVVHIGGTSHLPEDNEGQEPLWEGVDDL